MNSAGKLNNPIIINIKKNIAALDIITSFKALSINIKISVDIKNDWFFGLFETFKSKDI